MKSTQRIAVGYYKFKFKTLALFSTRKAAEAVFRLFCTPYSGKPKRKAPPVFKEGEKISLKHDGLLVNGWRWKPKQPNGKKILIVHGFDSCSYRFERYIVPLTEEGFEVVAFDAPGHGTSAGNTINALVYSKVILQAEKEFGSFYGIMAHSLGGLATSLAYEQLPNQEDRKLVLIAPTTETTTAIDSFLLLIPVGRAVQKEFVNLIEEVGQQPIAYYSVRRAIQNIQAPTLWIHDKGDRTCPYSDTIPVQHLKLPHIEFFTTKGLGHSGIYRQTHVFEKIMQFLSPSFSKDPNGAVSDTTEA